MSAIPANIQIKIQHADAERPKIVEKCLSHLNSPSDLILSEIGSYVGSIANNLRSALNYATIDFAENRLQNLISLQDFKELRRNLDFPYTTCNRLDFDRKPFVHQVRRHFPDVYAFLERYQPYHEKNAWLGHLMRISNIDKHITINEISTPGLAPMATTLDGTTLRVIGDKVMIRHRNGAATINTIPCYIELFHLFVSQEGNLVVFMITIESNSPRPDLLHFIQDTPVQVYKLVSDFYALL